MSLNSFKHGKRFLGMIGGLTLSLIIVGGPAASAQADEFDNGNWYLSNFHIPEAQAAGYTGKGVTIAVFDGAFNPDLPQFKGADIEPQDVGYCNNKDGVKYSRFSNLSTGAGNASHTTNIVGFIAGHGNGVTGQRGVAPDAKVLVYDTINAAAVDKPGGGGESAECYGDYTDPNGAIHHNSIGHDQDNLAKQMIDAMNKGATIFSMSIAFGDNPTPVLKDAVIKVINKKIIIVASVPNPGVSAKNKITYIAGEFPETANGVMAVQLVDPKGKYGGNYLNFPDSEADYLQHTKISGPGINLLGLGEYQGDPWHPMYVDGTSFATPITAAMLALVKQKYPNATGNQLIQSAIANTGGGNHAPVSSPLLGYGIISATSMLKVDPSQYPDVNPLINLNGNDMSITPTAAEFKSGMSSEDAELAIQKKDREKAAAQEKSFNQESKTFEEQQAANNQMLLTGIIIFVALTLLTGILIPVLVIVRKKRKKAKNGIPPTLTPQQPQYQKPQHTFSVVPSVAPSVAPTVVPNVVPTFPPQPPTSRLGAPVRPQRPSFLPDQEK